MRLHGFPSGLPLVFIATPIRAALRARLEGLEHLISSLSTPLTVGFAPDGATRHTILRFPAVFGTALFSVTAGQGAGRSSLSQPAPTCGLPCEGYGDRRFGGDREAHARTIGALSAR